MHSSRGSSWLRDQTSLLRLLPWKPSSLPLAQPGKLSNSFLKTEMHLPYHPAIPHVDAYIRMNTYVCTKTFTTMFIAALFMITPNWKPKHPTIEWINNHDLAIQWNIAQKSIWKKLLIHNIQCLRITMWKKVKQKRM